MHISVDTDSESAEGLRRAAALLEHFASMKDGADKVPQPMRVTNVMNERSERVPDRAPDRRRDDLPPRIEIIDEPEPMQSVPSQQPKQPAKREPAKKGPILPNVPPGIQLY